MKAQPIRFIGLLSSCFALAACSGSQPPIAPAFQRAGEAVTTIHRAAGAYTFVVLSGPSGTSYANGVNDRGWVVGDSFNYAPEGISQAILWKLKPRGALPLGALGGPASEGGNFWDRNGLIAGQSDTSNVDPYNENFCNLGDYICEGFVWEGSGLMPLASPFGGNNSYAWDVNDFGQVVGAGETATQDPSCTPPQVFDWEGVRWISPSQITSLPPVAGDSVSSPYGINDKGDVVGNSGPCVNSTNGALHAVLWRNSHPSRPVTLPTLGGTIDNTGVAINERGQIIGLSAPQGNSTFHAVLWNTSNSILDLGTLPGNAASEANGINNKGQIVGNSFQSPNSYFPVTGFLWQNGVMTDLNTLLSPSSPYYIQNADGISNNGYIAGQAFNTITQTYVAYILVPTGQPAVRGAQSYLGSAVVSSRKKNLAAKVRCTASRAGDARLFAGPRYRRGMPCVILSPPSQSF